MSSEKKKKNEEEVEDKKKPGKKVTGLKVSACAKLEGI